MLSLSRHSLTRSGIALSIVAGLLLPFHAFAGADDEIKFRKESFENVYHAARATGALLKGDLSDQNDVRLKLSAASLALGAAHLKDAFRVNTAGQGSEKTTVKGDEIWKNWADFSKRMDAFSAAATSVNKAVQKGDKKAAGENLKVVFGQCKGCHEAYRTN